MGLQLCHAGRRGSWYGAGRIVNGKSIAPIENGGWETVSPSSIEYGNYPIPHELTVEEIHKIVKQYGEAAARSVKCGYDFIEVGFCYLIYEFQCPLINHRTDEYGKNKNKFVKEVIQEVRKNIPKEMPLFYRSVCDDYIEGGVTFKDSIQLAKELHEKYEVDLINTSSGGIGPDQKTPSNWDHQLHFAKEFHKLGIPSAAVGGICDSKLANDLIANDEADLVLIGGGALRDAFIPRHVAQDLGLELPHYHDSYGWAIRKPDHTIY